MPTTPQKSALPKPPDADAGLDERRMTFGEHLDELRANLIRSALVLTLLLIVGFIAHEPVEAFVLEPYQQVRREFERQGRELPPLTGVDMMEGFSFTLRVVLYAALLFGMPYFLFEMWRFVAAGLYKHERKMVMRVLPVSIGLFVGGAAFSYVVLIPMSVEFMLAWSDPNMIKVEPRVESYLSFFLVLTVMLGVVFQLPLLQVILARFNLLSAATQARHRRGYIMAAVVAAAIITPTGDPVTLSLVAVPLLVLYEVGLLVARRIAPRS